MKKYGFPEEPTEIENKNKNNRNPSWSIKNKKIKKGRLEEKVWKWKRSHKGK